MKVKCIENKCGNSNFDVGKTYEVKSNRITCNFIHLNLPEHFVLTEVFDFAMCKFEVEKCKCGACFSCLCQIRHNVWECGGCGEIIIL